MAGFVPVTPIMGHGRATLSGVTGTSPAMTALNWPSHRDQQMSDASSSIPDHLIASGLTGEPTAPVIGIAGATNMNS
jgi:hypothetical protein